jgi:predicted phosphoadenosine phosphosulfate sulfurtransferase
MKKIYKQKNVFDMAKERIAYIFDNFKHINVSISGGKDSTVLWHLCLAEAIKRNRVIDVFFLDQEAEYSNTIEIIKYQMNHRLINAKWYQIPIYMTNATSYTDYFLYAWGENEKWIREKNPIAITDINEEYPKRFYEFFKWLEDKEENTANLVGLRAEEGIMRFRAVTKHDGIKGIKWSTAINRDKNTYKLYPLYDWTVYDIWHYLHKYNVKYNKIYDLMFQAGYSIYNKMRVSNLIHEMSYKSLIDLPKFEPETYNKLCKRISGVATASRYAMEKLVFSNKKLPTHYKSWHEFRDFLLNNIENEVHRDRFTNKFKNLPQTEKSYQKQVGQLLINDYESNKSYDYKESNKKQEFLKKFIQENL